MNEPTLSSNLEYLMKLHGDLSVSELARQVQLPQPTLHHILNGVTKKPRKQALESLAQFFSISIPQLIGALPLTSTSLNTVVLIEWEMLLQWPTRITGAKEIIVERELAIHSFALLNRDESLEPALPKGSLLIFEYEKLSRDRDYVVVRLSDNTVIFNRLFIDGNEHYIKQNLSDGNAKLLKLKFPEDKIVGTLVELRCQF